MHAATRSCMLDNRRPASFFIDAHIPRLHPYRAASKAANQCQKVHIVVESQLPSESSVTHCALHFFFMVKSLAPKKSRPSRVPADLLWSCINRGLTERAIAVELSAVGYHVSQATVHRRLADLRKETYTAGKTTHKQRTKLTPRTKRWLCRQIRVSGIRTTRRLHSLVQQFGVSVSQRTVLRGLQSIETLHFSHPKHCIPLTPQHKQQRLQWAQECLAAHIDWCKVLFADEKVWYLDGPNVRPKVWQDVRDPPQRLPRTGARNRSVYIWGAISSDFVPHFVCVPNVFTAHTYCQVLTDALLPYPAIRQYTLFHDRHPVHTAAHTNRWLTQEHIHHRLMPPKGADMNPIENIWAYLTAKVFPQNKTYTSTQTLIASIRSAWHQIQTDSTLRSALISSMPRRLEQVVANKGAWTKY